MPEGVFISLEGIEGTGKSTQAALLADALRARGIPVVLTAEPGGTPLGERIRALLLDAAHQGMDPMTELLLYAASRRQHLAEVILPSLAEGKTVVTDRFSDSTRAYQGAARGIAAETLDAVDRLATGGLRPHLTIVLDMEVERGLERNRAAGKLLDRLEQEETAFHRRVREGFLAIAKKEPERVRVVSAEGSMQEVHRRVMQVVGEVVGV
ncbi:MAG: dTMP kinase [Nitrospirota bacterium]|jgi:dTMP kinase